MLFRSFCAKVQRWSPLGRFTKNLPFSTTASIHGKRVKKENSGIINLEESPGDTNENSLENEKCNKHNKILLKSIKKPNITNIKDKINVEASIHTNQNSLKSVGLSTPKQNDKNSITMSLITNSTEPAKRKSRNLVAEAIDQYIHANIKNWKDVRSYVLENEYNKYKYTVNNLDANILGYCMSLTRYDLACSYYKFLLSEKLKPNLATLARYLKILYFKNVEKCSNEDEHEILTLYKEISEDYPVLDSNTLNVLILALSVTKKWKDTLTLIDEHKKFSLPSKAAYSAVTAALFLNKEESRAWSYLDEMLSHDKLPDSIVFLNFLKSIKKLRKKENILERLEKMFKFFETSEMICEEDVAHKILEFSKTGPFKCKDVKITLQGYCHNCGGKIVKSELTETEFEQLKQNFMKNVILGKDIFLKTDPSELTKFRDFLEHMEQFDVVLDGLNIAHSTGDKNPHSMAKLLYAVVKYYKDHNKSILVLGRVHMKTWPKESWKYILENSTVFLTRDISQDDPYLLYCALNSGKNTIVVTRDLMRSHKFLLKDIKFKNLFQKWLDQRQHFLLTLDKNGQPIFKTPADFSPIAQKNDHIWHIPYDSSVEDSNKHFHRTWLCINLYK